MEQTAKKSLCPQKELRAPAIVVTEIQPKKSG
jgi:hypothetical protein